MLTNERARRERERWWIDRVDGWSGEDKQAAGRSERTSERAEIIGRRDEDDDDDDDEDISDDEVRVGWPSVHCEGGLSRFNRKQLNERGCVGPFSTRTI